MKTKKVSLYGVLISLALVLSYVESLIPFNFSVPGIKIGLPNIVIVYALYHLGIKGAIFISLIRVLIVGMLFGNGIAFAYSFVGAFLALVVMGILKKSELFSSTGVSIIGALAHNFGQILVAIFFLKNAHIAYYLPVLCISGTVTGVIIGLLAKEVLKRVN